MHYNSLTANACYFHMLVPSQPVTSEATIQVILLSGNSQLSEGDSEAVGCAIERMLNVNRTLKVY